MTGLRHLGAFYRDDEDLVRTSVGFLTDAMAADEPVLVVLRPRHQRLVQERLTALAPFRTRSRLVFRGAGGISARPAQAMAGYRDMAAAHPSGRVRVLAEPDRRVDHCAWRLREWIRFEAAVNALMDDVPVTLLCLAGHDAAPATAQGMRWTHPGLLDSSGESPNRDYRSAALVDSGCDLQLGLPVPDRAEVFVPEGTDPAPLRARALRAAERAGLSPADRMRLLTVVTELFTNAVLHGEPPITCALWTQGPSVVCQLTDTGDWPDAAFLGLTPPNPPHTSTLGLWAVRALCPQLQSHTSPTATILRVTVEPTT
ncbi:sensor histidine kinase [Actinocorallia longicatena]|uniref:Sensor histidine kinase n=1 Tax=Actinocorallia longicatena TaxID=111803 RepID=A0ABP6QMI0_9ACTN